MRAQKTIALILVIVISLLTLNGCKAIKNFRDRAYAAANNKDFIADGPYKELDTYVVATPEYETGSADKLVAYITARATNDGEKARAIYRWITTNISYDVIAYINNNPRNLTVEEMLKSHKGVCGNYAFLFEELCKKAGLEVVTIIGYVRSSIIDPSDGNWDRARHAWNAVKVDGEWKLIDSTWGAGYVYSDKFYRRFNEFYFFADPTQFIYSHLPEDPKWQLLDPPIDKSEFIQLPLSTKNFFENGVNLISHKQGAISSQGALELSLGVPQGTAIRVWLFKEDRDLVNSSSRYFKI